MAKPSKYQPIVDLLENLELFLESANDPEEGDDDDGDEEPEPKSKPAPKKPAGKPSKKPTAEDDDDGEEPDADDDSSDDSDDDGPDDDGDEEEVVTQKDVQAVVKKIMTKTGGPERFQKVLTKYKLKTLQAAKASQLADLLDELNKVLKAVSK